jgi:predicted O-linked N-acetylglucosamine transferase (SPINDLY family)
MGVPVVSLAGKTAVSRGGLSILSNLSLPEFVATDRNQCIQTALELAADLPRLANFRANLRQHLRHSLLCDARQFTRDAESAFRLMWKDWCDAVSTPPGRARS